MATMPGGPYHQGTSGRGALRPLDRLAGLIYTPTVVSSPIVTMTHALWWTMYLTVLSGLGILSTQRQDEGRFLDLIETGFRGAISQGDAVTAYIYGELQTFDSYSFPAFALLLPTLTFASSRSGRGFLPLIVLGIFFLHIALQFRFLSKELVVLIMILAAITVIALARPTWLRTLAIAGIIGTAAAFFRSYYAVALLFFLLLSVLGFKRSFILGLCSVPGLYLVEDQVQLLVDIKVSLADQDAASNIIVLDIADPAIHLVANYFFSALQFAFPILHSLRPHEAYAQLFSLVLAAVLWQSWRLGLKQYTYPFLSFVLMYPLFIPDHGTFLRHTGVISLLLLCGVAIGWSRKVAAAAEAVNSAAPGKSAWRPASTQSGGDL